MGFTNDKLPCALKLSTHGIEIHKHLETAYVGEIATHCGTIGSNLRGLFA